MHHGNLLFFTVITRFGEVRLMCTLINFFQIPGICILQFSRSLPVYSHKYRFPFVQKKEIRVWSPFPQQKIQICNENIHCELRKSGQWKWILLKIDETISNNSFMHFDDKNFLLTFSKISSWKLQSYVMNDIIFHSLH